VGRLVAVLVEEEEGIDELVEDVVELCRLELGDLKPPIALVQDDGELADRSIAMERRVFAGGRWRRAERRKKKETVRGA
jgi:hypothetical protein